MLTTRGLGPSPSLATAGMGPVVFFAFPHGGSSGSYTWVTGTVAGKRYPVGQAAGNYGWVSFAVGKRYPVGAAQGEYVWVTGIVVGYRPPEAGLPQGQAFGAYAFSAEDVAGKRYPIAQSAGNYSWIVGIVVGQSSPYAGIMILRDMENGRIVITDR